MVEYGRACPRLSDQDRLFASIGRIANDRNGIAFETDHAMIIAQISDTHIGLGDPANGRDGAAVCLRRAVDHLMRMPARPM